MIKIIQTLYFLSMAHPIFAACDPPPPPPIQTPKPGIEGKEKAREELQNAAEVYLEAMDSYSKQEILHSSSLSCVIRFGEEGHPDRVLKVCPLAYSEKDIALKVKGHANFIQLEDYHETENLAFSVYPYIPEKDLDKELTLRAISRHKDRPLFTEEELRPIAKQLLEGLLFLRKNGIIHRDIKPANLILKESGTLIILDFGLSNITSEEESPVGKTPVGTMLYLAPEVGALLCPAPEVAPSSTDKGYFYDGKIDIFSAGMTLAQLYLGLSDPLTSRGEQRKEAIKARFEAYNHGTDLNLREELLKAKGASLEFRDFIYKMTVINPEDRDRVDECLDHPWLEGKELEAEVDDD